MQRFAPIVVLLVSGCVFLFAQPGKPQAPVRAVDGAEIFQHHCAACHGPDARGGGPVSKALARPAPDLTGLSRRNGGKFPAVHVRNAIEFGSDNPVAAHGSKEMPVWGPVFHSIDFDRDLGNVRLENVTKYLESIQQK